MIRSSILGLLASAVAAAACATPADPARDDATEPGGWRRRARQAVERLEEAPCASSAESAEAAALAERVRELAAGLPELEAAIDTAEGIERHVRGLVEALTAAAETLRDTGDDASRSPAFQAFLNWRRTGGYYAEPGGATIEPEAAEMAALIDRFIADSRGYGAAYRALSEFDSAFDVQPGRVGSELAMIDVVARLRTDALPADTVQTFLVLLDAAGAGNRLVHAHDNGIAFAAAWHVQRYADAVAAAERERRDAEREIRRSAERTEALVISALCECAQFWRDLRDHGDGVLATRAKGSLARVQAALAASPTPARWPPEIRADCKPRKDADAVPSVHDRPR